MQKNSKNKKNQKMYYDEKTLLFRYLKRYGLVLLIATPFAVLFSYIMSQEVAGYTDIVAVFCTLAIVLFAFFIAMVVFNKKDKKEEEDDDPEKHRDPFSD
jgi:amino acid permease